MEKFVAVPVAVTDVSEKGVITILWQIDDDDAQECFPTFKVKDLTELYETQAEAERVIAERRAAGSE